MQLMRPQAARRIQNQRSSLSENVRLFDRLHGSKLASFVVRSREQGSCVSNEPPEGWINTNNFI